MADRNGYLGRAPGDSSVIIARKTFEPTGVQTDFTFNSGYTPGYCDVYLNGVRLIDEKDFTASDGSTVGLTSAAQSGDVVELVVYKAYNLGVPVADITGNLDVTGNISASSSITAVSLFGDGTGITNIAGTGITQYIAADSLTVIGNPGVSTFTRLETSDAVVTGIITANGFSGNVTGAAITITGAATFNSNVTIGGTLTYEDVTNVDSLGIVTARAGVNVSGGELLVGSGVTIGNAGVVTAKTFTGDKITVNNGTSEFGDDVQFTGAATNMLWDKSASILNFPDGGKATWGSSGTDDLAIYHNSGTTADRIDSGNKLEIRANASIDLSNEDGSSTYAFFTEGGSSDLYYSNSKKFETTNDGTVTTGIATATGLDVADKITHTGDANTAIRFPANDTISFETAAEEHCRVVDTGNFLVGATAVEDWDGSRSHRIQVRGTSSNNAGVSALITANDDNPSELVLGKSRGTGNTIVQSADDVGQIRFAANDGAGFHSIAYVRASMDGTPGSDDLPSKLTFGTSADGGTTVSERLRINSAGTVRIKRAVSTSLDNDSIFLGLGDTENGTNVNRMIGFGYVATFGTSVYPASMGYTESDNSGNTKGALVFNTRNTTGATDAPVERLRITSSGFVGVATVSGNAHVSIYDAAAGEGTAKGQLELKDTAVYGSSPTAGIIFSGHHTDGGTAIFSGIRGFKANASDGNYAGALAFDVRAQGAVAYEAARIDSGGRLLVGTNTNRGLNGHDPQLQVTGTTYSNSTVSIVNNANDATGSYLFFGKQRSGAVGGSTVVNDGDIVGELRFNAGDGTDLDSIVARIIATVDGTPGGNDTPGRLAFYTTADGSASATERLRIDKQGDFRFSNGALVEKVNITAGKLSDNTNIDLQDGMVHYFTTQESTTSTPNIRVSSSISLNDIMTAGDVVTVTLVTTAAAGGYSANVTIDGNAVTEEWVGGEAPSEGGSDGLDIYVYTIICIHASNTGDSGFKVIANKVNASN